MVTINLALTGAQCSAGTDADGDTLTGIEGLIGSDQADHFTGNDREIANIEQNAVQFLMRVHRRLNIVRQPSKARCRTAFNGRGRQPIDVQLMTHHLQQPQFFLGCNAIDGNNVTS